MRYRAKPLEIDQVPATYRARFYAQVRRAGATECWEWLGRRNRLGYGHAMLNPKGDCMAHRLAWALAHGGVPANVLVLHHCDNPPCVNPAHLFLGSQADNVRDMVRKGRQFLQAHPERALRGTQHWTKQQPHRVPRGTARYNARLTPEIVRAIRATPPFWGRTAMLARRYGVGEYCIYRVLRGRGWTHVTGAA